MSPYELYEIILKAYDNNRRDAVEASNELIGKLESNPQIFLQGFINEVEEDCITNNKCPVCGCDIVEIDTHDEDRGEYLGQPCSERIYTYGCENNGCNYIRDSR